MTHNIRNPLSLVVLALTILLTVGSLAACGGSQGGPAAPSSPPAAVTAPSAAGAPASSGALKAMGDARVGDTTKCPVSGDEFTVDASSPKSEHNGKTIYFCCGGCKETFDADPAKYTNKN